MIRKRYDTDLTDDQWTFLKPLLPAAKPGGRPRSVDLREVVNAILYLLRTGCPWRHLPHDLPSWGTVWSYFCQWRDDGTLDRLHDDLREQVRTAADRDPQLSAGCLDSQSVKTAEKGARGYDTGKKIQGRKRHLVVDTLGLIQGLVVHPANDQDRAQVAEVADAVQAETGETVDLAYVDQGYTGEAPRQAAADHGIQLEVVKLPQAKRGFVLLPRRWVVERGFWLDEPLPATGAGPGALGGGSQGLSPDRPSPCSCGNRSFPFWVSCTVHNNL